MTPSETLLDVRGSDVPPFERIDDAISDLDAEERLTLVNSFEPVPLYEVLERRGFSYETRRVGEDHWRVAIERSD